MINDPRSRSRSRYVHDLVLFPVLILILIHLYLPLYQVITITHPNFIDRHPVHLISLTNLFLLLHYLRHHFIKVYHQFILNLHFLNTNLNLTHLNLIYLTPNDHPLVIQNLIVFKHYFSLNLLMLIL